jgi:putative endonuclease
MAKCSDGTYYTGYTTDLGHRLAAHNSGEGAKYTRSRRPVNIVWQKRFKCLGKALSEENRIKGLTRSEKIKIIRSANRKIGE